MLVCKLLMGWPPVVVVLLQLVLLVLRLDLPQG